MRVLQQILKDLANYPKHDYRGIRGTPNRPEAQTAFRPSLPIAAEIRGP
jgi:hypothetical protein